VYDACLRFHHHSLIRRHGEWVRLPLRPHQRSKQNQSCRPKLSRANSLSSNLTARCHPVFSPRVSLARRLRTGDRGMISQSQTEEQLSCHTGYAHNVLRKSPPCSFREPLEHRLLLGQTAFNLVYPLCYLTRIKSRLTLHSVFGRVGKRALWVRPQPSPITFRVAIRRPFGHKGCPLTVDYSVANPIISEEWEISQTQILNISNIFNQFQTLAKLTGTPELKKTATAIAVPTAPRDSSNEPCQRR
jgi:hypothetical protein